MKTCHLRLGETITGQVRGIDVRGTVVEIDAMYAWIAGSGYAWDVRRGPVRDPHGHLPVGKHSELVDVVVPTDPDELDAWMDMQIILCALHDHE